MPYYKSTYIEQRTKFETFLKREILPYVQDFDENQIIPRTYFDSLATNGFLGASIPKKFGGQEWDYITIGLMHEEFGKILCSLENILTVYGMVIKPLVRFGTEQQQKMWLPKIARGETIVGIALTEPNFGTDLNNIETSVIKDSKNFILTGQKKYITMGQIADLFLVLAKHNDQKLTLLVEKDTSGIEIIPIQDCLGLRANMLAEINFHNCKISQKNLIGQIGQGLTHVVACALDEGRYTTAWGSVGLGQACLNSAQYYTNERIQGNSSLKDHQLIQKMLTEIIVNVKAGREICFNVANLRNIGDFSYIAETLVAKYFCSKMAVFVANHTLQIFGACGFTKQYPVERFYRDAKIMEIIEGTSQVYEINIPKICVN
jgi:alkylation response protein AidB-like acyl-CoA dehydrogenase